MIDKLIDMPFQPGHQLSVGNKGNTTNHPSHSDIIDAAKWFADVFAEEQDIEELEKKVMSKKYSGRQITALRLLKGSERLMAKFMDKLVPDLVDLRSKGQQIGPNLTPEQQTILDSLLLKDEQGKS